MAIELSLAQLLCFWSCGEEAARMTGLSGWEKEKEAIDVMSILNKVQLMIEHTDICPSLLVFIAY